MSQPQVPKPVSARSSDTYVCLEIDEADLLWSVAARFKTNIQGESSDLLWLGKGYLEQLFLISVRARLPF